MLTSSVLCQEFIGRTAELEFIVDRLVCVLESHGVTLLVTGSAGIGKSRLAREAAGALERLGLGVETASCWESGSSPYGPLIEIARAIGAANVAEILRASDATTHEIGAEKTRRFAAVAETFATVAMRRPFVAIIEDLHWADRATLELLRYLGGALKGRHVGLLVTMREENEGGDAATLQLRTAIERDADATVSLEPLQDADIRLLLNSAVREGNQRVADVVIDEIAQLSDGRPFHAEELLRGMLDRRNVSPANQSGSHVPHSLRATVSERLSSLSDADRMVLAYAAVIGRRFALDFLAELTGTAMPDLLQTLRRARNLQLVAEESDGEHFVFRHALTREVVYDEILYAEARTVHAKIVRKLAASGADTTGIAYHAWRSRDAHLTEYWNEAAGDEAAAMFAHVSSIRHYERAANAAGTPLRRSALAMKLANALHTIGDMTESLPWFERAANEAEKGGDILTAQKISLRRGRALFESGRLSEGVAVAVQVTTNLAGMDAGLQCEAHIITAGLLAAMRRSAEAMSHLEAIQAKNIVLAPVDEARFLAIRAHALAGLGHFAQSKIGFARAEAAARNAGENELLIRTLNNWASDCDWETGDIRGAAEHFNAALAVAESMNAGRLIARLSPNTALARLMLGDFDGARAHVARGTQTNRDNSVMSGWLKAIAIRIGTLTGEPALDERTEAEALLAEAFTLEESHLTAFVAGVVAQARIMRGENIDDIAERAMPGLIGSSDAYCLLDGIGRAGGPHVAGARARLQGDAAREHCLMARAYLHLFDARVAHRERRRGDAESAARKAATAFKAMGLPVEEAYARELSGEIKDAVDIFRRIGAHAEVARLTATTDQRTARRRDEGTLTKREGEIAALIAQDLSNRQIAEALVISERTVENHVASIFAKLGMTKRRELAGFLGGPRTTH